MKKLAIAIVVVISLASCGPGKWKLADESMHWHKTKPHKTNKSLTQPDRGLADGNQR